MTYRSSVWLPDLVVHVCKYCRQLRSECDRFSCEMMRAMDEMDEFDSREPDPLEILDVNSL